MLDLKQSPVKEGKIHFRKGLSPEQAIDIIESNSLSDLTEDD